MIIMQLLFQYWTIHPPMLQIWGLKAILLLIAGYVSFFLIIYQSLIKAHGYWVTFIGAV